MTSVPSGPFDYKTRQYVLVPKPSRWSQKSERVVVHSPMLQIPETALYVPVKRYVCGQEDNAVCFLPREDIEDESSDIYENVQASRQASWSEAHGVALMDSSPDDELQYQRGDCFWVCIGSNTNGFDTKVPVINLRTFEGGTIALDHVCWIPRIRGPHNELWTLAGEIRARKLAGPKNYTYYSWVICQKTGIYQLTTKTEQIPTEEAPIRDRRYLSLPESRDLYERRYQHASALIKGRQESTGVLPPTPPLTPKFSDRQAQRIESENQISHIGTLPVPKEGGLDMWRRIFEMTRDSSGSFKLSYKLLNSSNIHPQRTPNRFANSKYRRSSSGSVATLTDPERTSPPHIHGLAELDGDGIVVATVLMDLRRVYRGTIHQSRLSGDESGWAKQCTENSKSCTETLLISRCDRRISKCRYSEQFNYKHFHSIPEKCRVNSSVHEHCISRRRPRPDREGPCMLVKLPSKNHKCCYWQSKDRENWSNEWLQECNSGKENRFEERRMALYDHSSLLNQRTWRDPGFRYSKRSEALKTGIPMQDQNHLINRRLVPHFENGEHIEGFGLGATSFTKDLDSGELDEEVQRVGMNTSSDCDDRDIDDFCSFFNPQQRSVDGHIHDSPREHSDCHTSNQPEFEPQCS
ncbi:hypothetical protein G7Y89_g5625 [Cudoniella acicularis]|uniref:Uncharacterized protein n=1 Tax=Cudoniella acicularis TaxID=354080 RepID=A0A8H4RM53_9HELO|nr:hypothetical protein G7Y89_g5625 [Cudoniella acicularis]